MVLRRLPKRSRCSTSVRIAGSTLPGAIDESLLSEPAERDLYQGLIKLAAGYVHAVRGNAVGLAKNLRGARDRLAAARDAKASTGDVDLVGLLAAIDNRLGRLAIDPADATIDPPRPRRSTR